MKDFMFFGGLCIDRATRCAGLGRLVNLKIARLTFIPARTGCGVDVA
jgi:hypothetical protein